MDEQNMEHVKLTEEVALEDMDVTEKQAMEYINSGGTKPLVPKPEEEQAKGDVEQKEIVDETEQKASEGDKKEEEKPEGEDQEDEESKEDSRSVPLQALRQERTKRQKESAARKELEHKVAGLTRTLEEVVRREQDRLKPAVPSEDEDPVGYLNHKNQELQTKVQELGKKVETQEQLTEEQKHIQGLVNAYNNDAQEFVKTEPQFDAALSYLKQNRLEELTSIGYTKEEANQILIQDELSIVDRAFKNEQNAAEIIFKMAKTRGFVSRETPQPANGNGASPKESDESKKPRQSVSKVDTIAKGVAANKSLSKVSGGAPENPDLEHLISLQPGTKEFDAAWKKLMGSR